MTDLPPLPPELVSLVESDRLDPGPTDEQRRRLARRLAITVGLGATVGLAKAKAASVSAIGGTAAAVSKVIVLVVMIVALGEGIRRFAAREQPVAVAEHWRRPSIVAPAPASPPPHAPPEEPRKQLAPATAPPIAAGHWHRAVAIPTGAASASDARAAEPRPAEPLDEHAVLARVVTALGQGHAEAALALIDDDARNHPNGALREERMALEVAALTAAGRTGDACDRADEFLRDYPDSIHRRALERLNCEPRPLAAGRRVP